MAKRLNGDSLDESKMASVQAVLDGIESIERGKAIPHKTVMTEMDALIDALERQSKSDS